MCSSDLARAAAARAAAPTVAPTVAPAPAPAPAPTLAPVEPAAPAAASPAATEGALPPPVDPAHAARGPKTRPEAVVQRAPRADLCALTFPGQCPYDLYKALRGIRSVEMPNAKYAEQYDDRNWR